MWGALSHSQPSVFQPCRYCRRMFCVSRAPTVSSCCMRRKLLGSRPWHFGGEGRDFFMFRTHWKTLWFGDRLLISVRYSLGYNVGTSYIIDKLRPGMRLFVELDLPAFPKTIFEEFRIVISCRFLSWYWPGPGVKLFSTMSPRFYVPIVTEWSLIKVLLFVS